MSKACYGQIHRMHGLNTCDYGARQHDPILGRWDRIDSLAEKYYGVSPYNYCHINPVRLVYYDGMDDYYDQKGNFLGRDNAKTDYILGLSKSHLLKMGKNSM